MRLFLRIFLAFWLATILMIAAVLAAGELWPASFPGERGALFKPEAASSVLRRAINTYEVRGAEAFVAEVQTSALLRNGSLHLIDPKGHVLASDGTPPPFMAQLADDAFKSNSIEVMRSALRVEFAFPIQSGSGKRYVAVLTALGAKRRISRPHFWFHLSLATLPATLVCIALSLYLTRPITRLRATAQRLAEGDLAARSSPRRITRGDELGDLARDFDIMAARIQQLMTAQRRFVADVSHELGAPLTRMHLAQALLRREIEGASSQALKRIERETDKLSSLVQQLLLLAGLEAGRCPEETMVPVALHSLCMSLIDDANLEAEHANCRVESTRDDVTILAYPQLLRRAIDNVLRNAIRYAPPGSEIQLNCRTDAVKKEVIVEVLDSGPGVPDSMLFDIFLPFFRTAPGRESNSGGTGLGLAIAAEAVRLHDGTIAAWNRRDGGLQVVIALPHRLPVS
ncbi:ATP-binding protein [Occallatibacter riparius]|uniref:histidine kinase n=1 Tax=Occallatibacter riparius TaxID=1002689 RepID=A0A9J7BNU5_9BACT|nr:ATP-binding protein [Occallatibacter riparius]UWZ82829.1 ATP-binding protein [Occallatibacter riparius]